MLRWLTAGESHGQALVAICEGVPAGVEITTADVAAALARRRAGYGRGARMKFEQDEAEITGGVRHGRTLGSPVAVRIGNTEWPKWSTVMSADPVAEADLAGQGRNEPLTRPRPGHADLVGMQKYGYDDARPILERASARETAARVALAELARRFLRQALGVEILSHVVAIGGVAAPPDTAPGPGDLAIIDADPVRCFDPATSEKMVAEIEAVRKDGDTLGGVVEVVVHGLPPGLGSHVHWDRRLDGRLAGAMMSIHAMKGVEIGDGFLTAARVALGELARRFLRQALGAEIVSHVVSIGSVSVPPGTLPGKGDLAAVDADPVRCLDPVTSEKMVAEIESARKDGDTLGGVVEVVVHGLPPGLGSHVHWDRRLDGRLAGAMMSIHAMKGVEIGDGFQSAARRGSQAHDEIENGPAGVRRATNRAGGIEGGISTGEPVRVRVAMKPISTVPRALATIDVRTGEPAKAINQRSDVTAVPASGVVAEAMAALVLADAALEKFGGDSVAETRRNLTSYLETLVIR